MTSASVDEQRTNLAKSFKQERRAATDDVRTVFKMRLLYLNVV